MLAHVSETFLFLFIKDELINRDSDAIFIISFGDIIGDFLHFGTGIAHSHSSSGQGQHVHVVLIVPKGQDFLWLNFQLVQELAQGLRLGGFWI